MIKKIAKYFSFVIYFLLLIGIGFFLIGGPLWIVLLWDISFKGETIFLVCYGVLVVCWWIWIKIKNK